MEDYLRTMLAGWCPLSKTDPVRIPQRGGVTTLLLGGGGVEVEVEIDFEKKKDFQIFFNKK